MLIGELAMLCVVCVSPIIYTNKGGGSSLKNKNISIKNKHKKYTKT